MSKMQFGISSASLYPQPLESTMRLFAELEIPAAEVFINTFSELSPAYLRELRRIADCGGTDIVSLHPFSCAFEPFLLFTGYPKRFEDALEFHKPYFEAMNLLGARYFIFHGDKWRGPNGKSYTSDEEYFERFARLRELARSFGVTVAQENVERCRSRSLDFLLSMLRYLGGDSEFTFDNKQALRSGVSWEEYWATLGSHVVHVHLSDNGPSGDCLPLGEGNLDLAALLRCMEGCDYSGAVLIELYGEHLPDPGPVFKSLDRLRSVAGSHR